MLYNNILDRDSENTSSAAFNINNAEAAAGAATTIVP